MTKSEQPKHSKKSKSKARQSDLFFPNQDGPDASLEDHGFRLSGGPVAGIDEVGRGPLAGPVVVAAVILDRQNIPVGLNDSKKLSEKKRDALFEEICLSAHVAIASASAAQIDQMNIRAATLWSMSRALRGLAVQPSYGLFDGRDIPSDSPVRGEAVVKGDSRSVSIAAASIVAKVARDRMMKRLGLLYPDYGFEKHMGYGTKAHLEALDTLGPCPYHRFSFRPIYERSDTSSN